MKNLVKSHLKYLISKTTLIIGFIVVFIILLVCLSSVFALNESEGYIVNNYFYLNNSFLITKIILVIFSVFIFGYSFTSKADQYVIVLIASGIPRIKIVITKVIAILIVILVICYFSYFEYVFIGFIFYKQFVFLVEYLFAYMALFLLVIYYGLISTLLIQIFDNIYTIIIPFALMNFGEIINEDKNIFIKVFNFVIPNYSNDLVFYFGAFHAIILCIILLVINIYLYNIKDIK